MAATSEGGLAVSVPYLPYTVKGAVIYFPDDAENDIDIYFLYSENTTILTTGLSPGENLFVPPGVTPYFVGHASAIHIPCNVKLDYPYSNLKMHVDNNNAYAIDIMGLLYIEVD